LLPLPDRYDFEWIQAVHRTQNLTPPKPNLPILSACAAAAAFPANPLRTPFGFVPFDPHLFQFLVPMRRPPTPCFAKHDRQVVEAARASRVSREAFLGKPNNCKITLFLE
jgi:hypothetical protein